MQAAPGQGRPFHFQKELQCRNPISPCPRRCKRAPVFALLLRTEPSNADPIRNLRWLLKAAKRSFGFHCVSATEVPKPAMRIRHPHADRAHDLYETPPVAVEALLRPSDCRIDFGTRAAGPATLSMYCAPLVTR